MSKNFELSELARKITVDNSNVAFTGVTLPSTSLENTGVTAGEYGSSSSIPVINVNTKDQSKALRKNYTLLDTHTTQQEMHSFPQILIQARLSMKKLVSMKPQFLIPKIIKCIIGIKRQLIGWR